MATLREQIVAVARSQLGTRYWSMHWGPKGSKEPGWGCAMFVAYCYKSVLGTNYVGSCYNYAGDCLGQSVNQGGGQFKFISAEDALPGDAVLYGAAGYNGKDYDDYGHIALYIGNGKVIGAMGRGVPGARNYLNIGISETTVSKQSLGGAIRYIRCTKLGKGEPLTHSKLATYVSLSPNHSGRRNHKVDTLTPHYMDGNLSIETCAQLFKPTSRKASSNYGIGSDGRIGVYVEEENRAWTSGSSANDNRAITFECANLAGGKLSDACWKSLVKLCADICKRYGFKGVFYCGKADYSKLPKGYMLLTMHKWFQDTDCPGPWLSKQFSNLAKDINAAMGAKASGTSTATSTKDKEAFPVNETITVKSDSVAVRTAPSTKTGKEVARYKRGQTFVIDGVRIANGYVWGTYIGASSGKRRYVALGPTSIAGV